MKKRVLSIENKMFCQDLRNEILVYFSSHTVIRAKQNPSVYAFCRRTKSKVCCFQCA